MTPAQLRLQDLMDLRKDSVVLIPDPPPPRHRHRRQHCFVIAICHPKAVNQRPYFFGIFGGETHLQATYSNRSHLHPTFLNWLRRVFLTGNNKRPTRLPKVDGRKELRPRAPSREWMDIENNKFILSITHFTYTYIHRHIYTLIFKTPIIFFKHCVTPSHYCITTLSKDQLQDSNFEVMRESRPQFSILYQVYACKCSYSNTARIPSLPRLIGFFACHSVSQSWVFASLNAFDQDIEQCTCHIQNAVLGVSPLLTSLIMCTT